MPRKPVAPTALPERPRALTINDIARLTGLSKATVSRAMNDRDRVASKTRARVMALLADSGYAPTRSAKALRTGRTGIIALMIGDNRNPNALSAIEGAVEVAHAAGLRVVVTVTRPGEGNDAVDADVFRGRMVDGGVLLFPSAADRDVLESLARAGVALVAVEPETALDGIPAVYADARHDGSSATRHLLSLGHRRIGIGLDQPGWGEQDRLLAGYRAALRAAGVASEASLVARRGWDFEAGRRTVRDWWASDDPPTAGIFCCDTATLGAVAEIRSYGKSVPDDFSVVGYDDTDVLRWSSPTVTSPSRRRRDLTTAACERLVALLDGRDDGPAVVRLRTEIEHRESTAPPRQ